MSVTGELGGSLNLEINAEVRHSVPQRFELHLRDTENPHGVTASQVGAYTKEEVDNKIGDFIKASDIYVDSDNYLCIDTEHDEGDDDGETET